MHVREKLDNIPGVFGNVRWGSALLPFVRVPALVAREMLDISPIGMLKHIPSVSPRVAKLDPTSKLQHFGRSMVGSLIMLKGAEAMIEGRISGSGPSNPSERSKLYETGWRPFSINVPGNIPEPVAATFKATRADDGSYWIPATVLGPVGSLLTTSAELLQGWAEAGERDDASMTKQIVEAVGRGVGAVADQTFLTDAINLAEGLDNPSRLYGLLQRKAASMVPAGVGFLQRQRDTTLRDPQDLGEAIKARIPGLSESVPAKIDRFGQEIQRPTVSTPSPVHPARSVLEAAGAPLNVSQGRITISPNTDDGKRLRAALETVGFEFDENHVIKLTSAERRALTQRRGKQTAEILAKLKNSSTYTALPKDAQKVVIERLKRRLETDRRMPELLELIQQRKGSATAR
jgi:hypothetical protein